MYGDSFALGSLDYFLRQTKVQYLKHFWNYISFEIIKPFKE